MKLPWLDPQTVEFPNTNQALSKPNGLLAAGGQLSIKWLLKAYEYGIFPWFNEGDPILWWTPSPRMVLYPHQFHISRSLRKTLKRGGYRVTLNHDFSAVIAACALPRTEISSEPSTWINPAMFTAYKELHEAGWAHSIEVWQGNHLIGGLYGVAQGQVFFGESMFSKESGGSKIAIAHLVEWLKQWQYKLIDCQVYNDHLSSLGAIEIDRVTFEGIVHNHIRPLPASLNRFNQWSAQEITRPTSYWINPRGDAQQK